MWYDAKLANYLSLLEDLRNKRIATNSYQAVLVVDKEEHLDNIGKMKKLDTNRKDNLRVMLWKGHLSMSATERLVQSFEVDEGTKEGKELEIKKNFYYVLDPESKVIDCAKIYSF